ncbi:MAG: hypothetical protein Tsb0021_12640 [Chlamydiales bacterium]
MNISNNHKSELARLYSINSQLHGNAVQLVRQVGKMDHQKNDVSISHVAERAAKAIFSFFTPDDLTVEETESQNLKPNYEILIENKFNKEWQPQLDKYKNLAEKNWKPISSQHIEDPVKFNQAIQEFKLTLVSATAERIKMLEEVQNIYANNGEDLYKSQIEELIKENRQVIPNINEKTDEIQESLKQEAKFVEWNLLLNLSRMVELKEIILNHHEELENRLGPNFKPKLKRYIEESKQHQNELKSFEEHFPAEKNEIDYRKAKLKSAELNIEVLRIQAFEKFLTILSEKDSQEDHDWIHKRIDAHKNTIQILSKELKSLKKELAPFLAKHDGNIDYQTAAIEHEYVAHFVSDRVLEFPKTWHLKNWAQILIKGGKYADSLVSTGKDFQDSINHLEEEIDKLDRKLIGKNETSPDDLNLRKDLQELKRRKYQVYLQRTIDVIGSLNRTLKKGNLDPSETKKIQQELKELNRFYEKTITKYKSIISSHQEEKSFIEAVANTIKKEATFGYLSASFVEPKEFEVKKYYADLGYVLMENVKEWLDTLTLKEGETTWQDIIIREVKNFWKWAETHPRAAEGLVANLKQTVDILNNESETKTFLGRMETRAFTNAFLGQMKSIVPQDDPLVVETLLKYKALADLAEYLPFVTSIGKSIGDNLAAGNLSLTKNIVDAAKAALKTRATQSLSNIISSENTEIVAMLARAIRGDSFWKIMEQRRNLELVRLSGVTKEFLLHPKNSTTYIKNETIIWFKSIAQARTPMERIARIIVQVVFPLGIFIVTVALLPYFVLSNILTLGATVPISGSILSMGVTTNYKLYQLINKRWSQTRVSIETQLKTQRMQKNIEKLKQNENAKTMIEVRAETFILQAQKWKMLHKSEPISMQDLKKSNKIDEGLEAVITQTIKTTIENKTYQLKQEHSTELRGTMNHFKTVTDYQKLKAEIKKSFGGREIESHVLDGIVEKIARDVMHALIENWLKEQVQEAMFKETAQLYENYYADINEYKLKNQINIEDNRSEDTVLTEELKRSVPNDENRNKIENFIENLVN